MSKESRYRLAFNAPGARNNGRAPSVGDFRTLAGALAAAMVMEDSGSGLLGVTVSGLPVMNVEELSDAVVRLRTVARERHGDSMIACAARVLREIGLE